MELTKKLRSLLALSAALAIAIGATILFAPADFHATNGIELAADANLLSEVRAPGAALAVLGLLMLVGVFVRAFALTSTSIAAAVFLAYGGGRLLSMGLDGLPGEGLVVATVIEIVVGALCAAALVRHARRAQADVAPVV